MRRIKDLTGNRYGLLTAVELLGRVNGQTMWKCVCDCGETHIASSSNLQRGNVKSCGCYRKEFSKIQHTTHGESKSRLYYIWDGMKRRCKGTSGEKTEIITQIEEYQFAKNGSFMNHSGIGR